jgi:hypothetical protein
MPRYESAVYDQYLPQIPVDWQEHFLNLIVLATLLYCFLCFHQERWTTKNIR